MKICRVRLKNIRSLTATTEVNFESEQIQKEGLFLICGETGVGKTTLFDAITLALYKKVPSGESEDELVSYGRREAFAEVEFESKGKRYRSRWSFLTSKKIISREKKSYELDLLDGDIWVPISDGLKKSHTEKIKQITGLNFEEFTRSVLLAQGQFAQFLHAKSKERSDLLDSIAGTAYYRELSRKTYEVTKQAASKLEFIQKQYDEIEVWDKETIILSKKELKQSEALYSATKLRIKQFEKQQLWLKEYEASQLKNADILKQLDNIEPKRNLILKDFKKVEKHQVLAPLVNYQLQNEKFVNKQIELQALINNHQKKLPELKQAIKDGQSNIETQKEHLKSEKESVKKLELLIQEVIKLDTRIESLKHTVDQTEQKQQQRQKRHAEFKAILENLNQKQALTKGQLVVVQNQLAALTPKKELFEKLEILKEKAEQIQQLSLSQSNTISQLEKNKARLQTLITEIEALSERLKKGIRYEVELKESFENEEPRKLLEACNTELADCIKNLNTLRLALKVREKLDTQQSTIEKLQEEQTTKQRQKNDLNEQYQQIQEKLVLAQKVVAYADAIHELKQSLETGKPCQVCGSIEHPTPASNTGSEDRQKLQELEKASEKLENQLKILNADIQKRQGLLSAAQNYVNQLQTELQAYTLESSQTKDIMSNIGQLEQKEDSLQQKSSLLKKNIEKLEKCEKKLQALKLEKHKLQVEKSGTEKEQAHLQIRQQDAAQKILSLQQWLQVILQPWKLDKIAIDKSIEQIKTEKEDFENLQREKETLQKDFDQALGLITEKNTELKELTQLISETKNQVELQQKELLDLKENRSILFGDKSVEKEQQLAYKRLDEEEKKHQALQDTLDKYISDQLKIEKDLHVSQTEFKNLQEHIEENNSILKEKLSELPFSIKPTEIASFLLPEDKVQDISRRKNELEEEWKRLQYEQDMLQKQLITLEKTKPEGTYENLDQLLQNENDKLTNLEQSIQQLKIQLNDNESKNVAKTKLKKQLEEQQALSKRWGALNDLIGSASGHKFQQFAQNLTMRQLCILANKHLVIIAPRYRIYTEENNKNIREFWILDKYQADNKRSISTLSGGETFLVSLALALGMSDMAGTQTKIESLFIDEGFGTLDSQTLDIVMDALENLQSSGKTIGIISHVKELKERIRTQIQVFRKGRGTSRIETVV